MARVLYSITRMRKEPADVEKVFHCKPELESQKVSNVVEFKMAKFFSFEEIKAWKKARELNIEIYSLTASEKFSKDFVLRDQIRRASVSISSNIAEGFERETTKEFLKVLIHIKGFRGRIKIPTLFSF